MHAKNNKADADFQTTLDLAKQLVRSESITPDPAETLSIIKDALAPLGAQFYQHQHAAVHNMLATMPIPAHKKALPRHLLFLGHVDVVPAGDPMAWRYPPFSGQVAEEALWGRGTADMKGAITAFIGALRAFVASDTSPGPDSQNNSGRISLLLTSDEEGAAQHGIKAALPFFQKQLPDLFPPGLCLVGEPTSGTQVGDTLKVGRRGSLYGDITFHSASGHAAYPSNTQNPAHALWAFLDGLSKASENCETASGTPLSPAILHALKQGNPVPDTKIAAFSSAIELDQGYPGFPPSTFVVTGIDAPHVASNVTPDVAKLSFALRFNPCHTEKTLVDLIRQTVQKQGLEFKLNSTCSGHPYLSQSPELALSLRPILQKALGLAKLPTLSTGGGISDGRFFASLCPVIELGLLSKGIHQPNECVALADLNALETAYEATLAAFFTGGI